MKKQIVLPITTEVDMHCHPFFAYWLAILTSSRYVNDYLAEYELEEEGTYEFISDKVKREKKGKVYRLQAEKYETALNCKFFKPFQSDCTVDFSLHYHQYTDQWACCGLFIADHEEMDCKDITEYKGYFIGFSYQQGFFEMENGEVHPFDIQALDKETTFKLSADKKSFTVSILCDKKVIVEVTKPYEYKNRKEVGVYFNFYENRFYDWFYMSFLQIHFHERFLPVCGAPAEALTLPIKETVYNQTNPLLDFYIMRYDVLHDFHDDFIQFVQCNLAHQNYIEILLDEYYINNSGFYHTTHYTHLELIYGIDYEKELVYLLLYKEGQPIKSEVPFGELLQAVPYPSNERITCIKYQPDYYKIEFDIETVRTYLEEFLYAKNSSAKYRLNQTEKYRKYGFSIFSYILKDNENFTSFTHDIRIAYTMYEYNKHVYELLSFLYIRKYMTKEQYDQLECQFKELIKICYAMVRLLIKFNLNGKQNVLEKVRIYVEQIRDLEAKGIGELIELLK